jgi:hypothetical protein
MERLRIGADNKEAGGEIKRTTVGNGARRLVDRMNRWCGDCPVSVHERAQFCPGVGIEVRVQPKRSICVCDGARLDRRASRADDFAAYIY